MEIANQKICPNCGEPIPTTGCLIHACTNNLKSEYSIIPDEDAEVGIALALGGSTSMDDFTGWEIMGSTEQQDMEA